MCPISHLVDKAWEEMCVSSKDVEENREASLKGT